MRRPTRGALSPETQPTATDIAVAQAREAARLLLSPETVADRLELSRATIYRMIERGELHSIKIGASRRIPVRELEAYIEAHTTPQAS